MARKPKASTTEIDNRSKLLEALRFTAFASSGHDNEQYQYVKIKSGILSAADNVIAMGMPVDSELEMCLHGGKFKAALEQCGQNFQFTQVDKVSVSLRSEKFRAMVPTIDTDLIADFSPDEPCAMIDDRIKKAFDICNEVIDTKGDRAYTNCLQLNSCTAISTNGAIALECWHGIDLPNGLNIPKRAILAIIKCKKPLAAFGFSNVSATFYFDDNSYVKTKLIDANYPNVQKLYDMFINAPFIPLPQDFFIAMDAIEGFIQDDTLLFHNGFMATNRSLDIGANYRVDGLPGNYAFGHRFWNIIRPLVTTFCFHPDNSKPCMFYGDNLRGLISGRHF